MLIISPRYAAILLGPSGNRSFVSFPPTDFGNASNGTAMWNPWFPENLTPTLCIPKCFNACTNRSAAIFEYSSSGQSISSIKSHPRLKLFNSSGFIPVVTCNGFVHSSSLQWKLVAPCFTISITSFG